jgi:hypothetical protein
MYSLPLNLSGRGEVRIRRHLVAPAGDRRPQVREGSPRALDPESAQQKRPRNENRK